MYHIPQRMGDFNHMPSYIIHFLLDVKVVSKKGNVRCV